jgi:hypothetical protein
MSQGTSLVIGSLLNSKWILKQIYGTKGLLKFLRIYLKYLEVLEKIETWTILFSLHLVSFIIIYRIYCYGKFWSSYRCPYSRYLSIIWISMLFPNFDDLMSSCIRTIGIYSQSYESWMRKCKTPSKSRRRWHVANDAERKIHSILPNLKAHEGLFIGEIKGPLQCLNYPKPTTPLAECSIRGVN